MERCYLCGRTLPREGAACDHPPCQVAWRAFHAPIRQEDRLTQAMRERTAGQRLAERLGLGERP